MHSRARLLEQIGLGGPAVWLIEAGAGFGKTVLLENLVASASSARVVVMRGPIRDTSVESFMTELSDAARRAHHVETAEILAQAPHEPRAVVDVLETAQHGLAIDDVQDWSADTHEFITRLAAAASGRVPLIMAGRRCPIVERGFSSRRIGAVQLALTIEQAGVTGSGDIAIVLHQTSHGWPLAVTSMAQRMSSASNPTAVARELGNHRTVVDHLLDINLMATDSSAELARQLAALPFFDDEIASALGTSEQLEALLEAGLAITRRPDGWSEIAEPFRSSLGRTSPKKELPPPAVLRRFVQRGEVATALNLCLARGDRAQAAKLIASLSFDEQMFVEPDALQVAMIEIAEEADAAPRCLLVQAQINGTHGRGQDALRCVERGVELFAERDPNLDEDAHIEMLLELGIWRTFHSDLDAARKLSDTAAPHIHRSVALKAKSHDLQGLIASREGTFEGDEHARVELTEALKLWRELGETRPAATTTFRLASQILGGLGRRPEALALLENLPKTGEMTLINTARLGMERALLMPYVGRADEVEDVLADTRRVAGLLGHDWIITWSMSVQITAWSVLGQASEAAALFDAYVDQGRQMHDEFSQTIMWCEASEALARLGDLKRAKSALDRTRDFQGLPDWFLAYYEASFLARSGNAEQAQRELDALSLSADVDRERRWIIHLLRAYCCWQLNDAEGQTKMFDECMDECRSLDQPMLPSYVEREILAKLQGGPPTPAEVVPGEVRVRLCGDFGVDGREDVLERPIGHSATLLKFLVLHNGRITLEQALDVLWPETDPTVSRPRMRNVLNRLRQTHGDLVRRVEESLELADGVTSDYHDAVTAAERALRPRSERSEVEAALALHPDSLLPSDRYEDWAEEARNQWRTTTIRLFDRLAVVCEDAGDIDAAADALERAHGLDAFDDRRPDRAAALLRAAGRDTAAIALLERCRV